jgi:HTH-type transcriptional regulator/antitoxin HigA
MTSLVADTPPPGEFIREELEARGWSQRDLAYVLGVAEQSVNQIVSGKRGISAEMAKAMGDAFDVPAQFFVNLQSAYELSKARVPDPSVSRKAKLQGSFPLREMIRRGWVPDVDTSVLEGHVARFFELENGSGTPEVAFAAKRSDSEEPPAQIAWLFRVRQLAREMVVPPYSQRALKKALEGLNRLMVEPEEARHVPRVLSECGVCFVLVENLPGSKIDGVCTWLRDGTTPVIGMSTRYDRIDNFWFVLRHEIEHVLLKHGVESAVVDTELEGEKAGTGEGLSEEERLANAAASDFCVPRKQMDSFYNRKYPYFYEKDVIAFARSLGVHPGIVAGQLRWRLKKWTLFSKLLVKVRFAVASSAIVDGWGNVAPVST